MREPQTKADPRSRSALRGLPASSLASTTLGALDHARRQAGELRHLDAVGAVGGARRPPRAGTRPRPAIPSPAPWRCAAAASLAASAVSSWKCVANSARQRLTSCRCSTVAQAIDRPSKVAVPRPISSRITSARSPAWLRIAAVSTISTMKVERPRARSSAAPTRENSRSTTPICAALRRHEAAHLREHRDQRVLPQERRLAGHVGPGEQPDAAGRRVPAAARDRNHWRRTARRRATSACSTTGWRPPSTTKASDCRRPAAARSRARPRAAQARSRHRARPAPRPQP